MKKKHLRFRVGQMKNVPSTPVPYSPQWVAMKAKRAMDKLAPMIKEKKMSPNEAIVLVALYMDCDITGNPRWMSQEQILKVTNMILIAWKQGLFKPCATYPYTLDETLAADSSEE